MGFVEQIFTGLMIGWAILYIGLPVMYIFVRLLPYIIFAITCILIIYGTYVAAQAVLVSYIYDNQEAITSEKKYEKLRNHIYIYTYKSNQARIHTILSIEQICSNTELTRWWDFKEEYFVNLVSPDGKVSEHWPFKYYRIIPQLEQGWRFESIPQAAIYWDEIQGTQYAKEFNRNHEWRKPLWRVIYNESLTCHNITKKTKPITYQHNYCCRYCTKGCACGNSCIACWKTCHIGAGCACNL